MSLLSNFISTNLLNELEAAFIAHEPDLQLALLNEVQVFSAQLVQWIEKKITVNKSTPTTAS